MKGRACAQQVPPIDLEYRHHFKEYYLNTFGYLLEDPEVRLERETVVLGRICTCHIARSRQLRSQRKVIAI